MNSRFLFIFLAAGVLNSAPAHSKQTVLDIGFGSRLIVRSAPTENDDNPTGRYSLAEGPWGTLDAYPIYLQNPDTGDQDVDRFSNETRWVFPEQSREDVFRQLEEAGISESTLRQYSYSLISTGGTIICPNDELIEMLSPETRVNLRNLLKVYSENSWYMNPVIISDHPLDWYTRAGLREETALRIASVCYRENGLTLFSDPVYVLSHIPDREEKVRFMKTLTRVRTLILRLQISASTDLDVLQNYWSLNSRRKEILPLLKSISEAPQTEKIDVIQLLPPSGRQRLYTYPRPDRPVNCFISSLEFIGIRPGPVEDRPKVYAELFRDRLVPAKGALQFGDILVCFDKKTDEPVHSAVYIAADIVFTKNGISPDQPWTFMQWDDMIRIYNMDTSLNCKVYRAPK